jgi:hypothetical protein
MGAARAHTLCSRFQPVIVPQRQIKMADGKEMYIVIPSLYGIASRLSDPLVVAELECRGIPIADN